MNNKIFTLLVLLFCANIALGQRHICGVTHDDQSEMIKFIEQYNNTPQINTRSTDPVYIPIKVHMTANNDGTGRIKANGVLDQMAVLIEDYKKVGMYLYLQDARPAYLDNTSIYNNPGTFENTIVLNKDPDALNIFCCENANPDESPGVGIVAGFYNTQGDYIIMSNQFVVQAGTTLTHEMGHLFSLPHTFFGWEYVYAHFGWVDQNGNPTPWNVDQFGGQWTQNLTPTLGYQIELVNGSNCTQTADRICDTPPDYNFGLGAGGCVWNNTLRDKNGDVIDPQENNFMSYFDCPEAVFTEDQKSVMIANYNSSARDHIRSDYEPDTTEITSNHELTAPGTNEQLEYYNNVLLDWTDAEGASNYLVSINSGSGDFFEYYTTESALFIDELEPNTFYFWEVRPFNEGFMDTESKSDFFLTGSDLNTSVKESKLIKDVNVFPNPSRSGQNINVAVSVEKNMEVTTSIIDLTGKMVKTVSQSLTQGQNMIQMESILEAGIYILKIDTEDGSIHKKIMVQ